MSLADALDAVVAGHLGQTFPAAALVVLQGGQEVYARAAGWLDPEQQCRPARLDTLYDLASLTKLFTVTAFMTYVEQERVGLDQPVQAILPEFCGVRAIAPYPDPLAAGAFVSIVPVGSETVDAARVTFRQLLAHISGLPSWLPLYREGSRARALEKALHTDFAYPAGSHSVYSDIGLILLGLALERLAGARLDILMRERVCAPLGLRSIQYNPPDPFNVAPTEVCAWRERRILAEVHDENAAGLDGIAGHAGLFAGARDVAALGEMYLRGGAPLLQPETVAEMTRPQSQDGPLRRGLGFALWSHDPEAAGNPYSPESFGHTGFTGTGIWIDPARELVVVFLTNRVYYGRDNADSVLAFRLALNRALAAAYPGRTAAFA